MLALGKISFKKLKKKFARVPKTYTLQNMFLKNKKKIYRVPWAGTWQNIFKKNCRVPEASTRQNKFLKIKKNCRVPAVRHSAKSDGRWPPSWAGHLLPRARLYRVPGTRQIHLCRVRYSAKYCFAECPNKKHSVKSQALGKVQFSNGVCRLN